MSLFKPDRTAGEFVLRFARFRGIGNRRLLNRVLKNEDMRYMASALIADELSNHGLDLEAGEEGFFVRLINWLSDPENQAKIEAIIEWLKKLFEGM